MKLTIIIVVFLTSFTIISQTYVKMANAETQPFRVVKIEKDYEVRLYPMATMATISMNLNTYSELSSAGFRKLAGFIFGGNEADKNIAMTTPVHMDIQDAGSSMSFVMPTNYNKDNLPKPNDSSITIKTSAEEYVAAIEFGGYANDKEIKKYAVKLENALKLNGVEFYGNFRFLGYNAPYKFWGRKNEIIVSVRWNEK